MDARRLFLAGCLAAGLAAPGHGVTAEIPAAVASSTAVAASALPVAAPTAPAEPSVLRMPTTSTTPALTSDELRALWRFADQFQSVSDYHIAGLVCLVLGSEAATVMFHRGNTKSGELALGLGTGIGAILEVVGLLKEHSAARELQPLVDAAVRAGAKESANGWMDITRPGGCDAKLEGTTVVLTWQEVPGFPRMAGYVVHRGSAADVEGTVLTDPPTADTSFRDRTAHPKIAYRYWVTVRTTDGRDSLPSEKVPVTLP